MTDFNERITLMSDSILKAITLSFPDASPDDIRISLGVALAGTHRAILAIGKTVDEKSEALDACMHSFECLGVAFENAANEFGFPGVRTGIVNTDDELPPQPSEIN